MGLEITACTVQLRQILDKSTKRQKNLAASSKESGAKTTFGVKAEPGACHLLSTPPEGWAKHPSHHALMGYKKQVCTSLVS